MKAPDKIYLTKNDPTDSIDFDIDVNFGSVMWERFRLTDYDVAYIRKDLLLEWVKELTSEPYNRTTESARKYQIANYILEKYNSL